MSLGFFLSSESYEYAERERFPEAVQESKLSGIKSFAARREAESLTNDCLSEKG